MLEWVSDGWGVSLGDFTPLQDIVIVCDHEWNFVDLVTNRYSITYLDCYSNVFVGLDFFGVVFILRGSMRVIITIYDLLL